jgi:hypothetical protein
MGAVLAFGCEVSISREVTIDSPSRSAVVRGGCGPVEDNPGGENGSSLDRGANT